PAPLAGPLAGPPAGPPAVLAPHTAARSRSDIRISLGPSPEAPAALPRRARPTRDQNTTATDPRRVRGWPPGPQAQSARLCRHPHRGHALWQRAPPAPGPLELPPRRSRPEL